MYHKLFKVTDFKIIGSYVLHLFFDDDSEQIIDFEPVLYGEMWGELRDLALFNQVALDPIAQTIIWPNDADFDPEASVRSALTRAALATRGCKFYDVVCFPSDAAATEGKGGLHLDDEDLDTLTLLQLRDSLGLNLVVHEHTPVKVPETEWIELCVAEAVVAEALLIGEQ